MFAPASSLYNLTTHTLAEGEDFVGVDIETVINKSIRVEITLNAYAISTFNRIRLAALEYETYGDIPTVRIVAEQSLSASPAVFIDSGNSIGILTLEEFQVIRNDMIPATI
jgi:hypothetical protein